MEDFGSNGELNRPKGVENVTKNMFVNVIVDDEAPTYLGGGSDNELDIDLNIENDR